MNFTASTEDNSLFDRYLIVLVAADKRISLRRPGVSVDTLMDISAFSRTIRLSRCQTLNEPATVRKMFGGVPGVMATESHRLPTSLALTFLGKLRLSSIRRPLVTAMLVHELR